MCGFVCICVCVCVCTYVCISVCECVRVYIYFARVPVFVCISMCACVYLWVYVWSCGRLWIYANLSVWYCPKQLITRRYLAGRFIDSCLFLIYSIPFFTLGLRTVCQRLSSLCYSIYLFGTCKQTLHSCMIILAQLYDFPISYRLKFISKTRCCMNGTINSFANIRLVA